ncbi:MAG: peptide chain release factor-like protein [Acidimicrobiia bacterium]
MRFTIPDSELIWRFDTSGGPGGQHANRSNTRAILTFSIDGSEAFDEAIRERLLAALGPSVRVVEDGSRSQTTNRKRALRRLHSQLEDAAKPRPPRRRRTGPSHGARQRRLDQKRARSHLKQSRRRPGLGD